MGLTFYHTSHTHTPEQHPTTARAVITARSTSVVATVSGWFQWPMQRDENPVHFPLPGQAT